MAIGKERSGNAITKVKPTRAKSKTDKSEEKGCFLGFLFGILSLIVFWGRS